MNYGELYVTTDNYTTKPLREHQANAEHQTYTPDAEYKLTQGDMNYLLREMDKTPQPHRQETRLVINFLKGLKPIGAPRTVGDVIDPKVEKELPTVEDALADIDTDITEDIRRAGYLVCPMCGKIYSGYYTVERQWCRDDESRLVRLTEKPPIVHTLKTEEHYFDAIMAGDKTFEIRYNGDRGFQKGDIVILQKLRGGVVTVVTEGKLLVRITYVTAFKQQEGYVVFGFEKLQA
jgi:ASC-1-like (ASCH) protein